MKIKFAENKKVLKCGCILESEQREVLEESKYHKVSYKSLVWILKTPCKEHTPNYGKKADKAVYRANKKTGRGYTKSSKPLEKRK